MLIMIPRSKLFMSDINLVVNYQQLWVSHLALLAKNLLANAGNIREVGSVPGLGRSSGEGNGNPPQYSCLGNPMDKGF